MLNNTIVLNLLEARVTLYATGADGLSLGAALWSGQVAERLTVREQWVTLETRPAGAAYPIKHPLVPQFEISIDRVWALPLNNLVGFSPTNQTYVLEVIWTEEDTQQWHRRRFYGVTIAERSFAPQSIESEFVDGQEFAAQYVVADAGSPDVAPSATVAMPLMVVWSGSDGIFPLYNYDEVNGFVLADPPWPGSGAASAGRATIAADGSSIQFNPSSLGSDAAGGAFGPVLTTAATGVVVGELHDTQPTDLPQLQFYVGTTLLGVVNMAGVWARVIADVPPSGALPAGAMFTLEYEGTPVAVLEPGQATALAWTSLN